MTRETPQRGDRYRHFKGGEYEILGVSGSEYFLIRSEPAYWATHTETGEILTVWRWQGDCAARKSDRVTPIFERFVIYQPFDRSKVWARPLDNFLEALPAGSDNSVNRFARFELLSSVRAER